MEKQEIIGLIKDNLSLDITYTDRYNGGMGEGGMYTKQHMIMLMFDGQIISEIEFDSAGQ